jgi:hypothetical protein
MSVSPGPVRTAAYIAQRRVRDPSRAIGRAPGAIYEVVDDEHLVRVTRSGTAAAERRDCNARDRVASSRDGLHAKGLCPQAQCRTQGVVPGTRIRRLRPQARVPVLVPA